MTNSSREPFSPILSTDADVTTMWRTIINPLGWHTRRLYIVFVAPEGRPNPQIIEVDEMPDGFSPEDADVFVDFLGHIVRDVDDVDAGSAALMFARPGSALLTEDDRSLCRELYAAAQRSGVRLELVHVGTDTEIVPAPMDEVLPRSA